MVDYFDADYSACRAQRCCRFKIIIGRTDIAAWMVVAKHDGRTRIADCGAEDLAGMHDAFVKQSLRYQLASLKPAFTVHKQNIEFLLTGFSNDFMHECRDSDRA